MGRVISPNLQTRAYGARERPPVSPDYRVPPHLQTPGSVTALSIASKAASHLCRYRPGEKEYKPSYSVTITVLKISKNCCHQMSYCKDKMHHLISAGALPRPHCGSLQRSQTPSCI